MSIGRIFLSKRRGSCYRQFRMRSASPLSITRTSNTTGATILERLPNTQKIVKRRVTLSLLSLGP